jgi:hypothetical protein
MTVMDQVFWLQPYCLSLNSLDELRTLSDLPQIFIWDQERFENLGIGEKRQAFIYQVLQAFEDVTVLEGSTLEVLRMLRKQPVDCLDFRKSKLFSVWPQNGQLGVELPEEFGIEWIVTPEMIAFDQPIPFGYFKYWKQAQAQLGLMDRKKRAHK